MLLVLMRRWVVMPAVDEAFDYLVARLTKNSPDLDAEADGDSPNP
jgi:hypothetical protein